MKRLLLALWAVCGLLAAPMAVQAAGLDSPIVTARAERVEYVHAPETTAHRAARSDGSFQLASLPLLGAGPGASGVTPIVFSTSLGAYIDADTQIGTAASTALGGVSSSTTMTVFWWELESVNTTAKTTGVNTLSINTTPATQCEPGTGAAAGLCMVAADNSGGTPARMSFNNSDGSHATDGVSFAQNGGLVVGQWNLFMGSVDSVNQVRAFYTNGNLSASQPTVPLNLTVDLANGGGFGLQNRNTSFHGYAWLDNVYVSTESWVCTSSSPLVVGGVSYPCTGANTIPVGLRNLVRDPTTGKALDLGATCAITGRQPEVCLNGGAANMATNKGFGTGLAVRVASSGLGSLFQLADAPFGPGQGLTPPAGKPTLKWLPSANYAVSQSCTVNACTMTADTNGQPVAAGDALILIGHTRYTTPNTNTSITCPDGTWTQTQTYDSNGDTGVLCTKIASGTTNSWTLNYTKAGSVYDIGWLVLDYVGATAFDVQAVTPRTSTGTTWSFASGTAAVANETLVNVSVQFDQSQDTWKWTSWSAGTRRYRTPYVTGVDFLAVDEYALPSGAFTARTATISTTATGNTYTVSMEP